MISVILISIVLLAALILATVAVVRRLGSADRSLPVTAEWIDELSTDRYRPMMRLLDSRDIEFLRSQAGFTPKMESKLRAQRCQIFRGYLRCLDMDFQRVCMALKLVLVQSEQDRPGSFRGSGSPPDHVCFRLAGRAFPPFPVSLGYLHGRREPAWCGSST